MRVARMDIPPAIWVPLALALAGGGLLLWPGAAEWSGQAWFIGLPYLVFAAAAALGLAFTQTRFLFFALCAAATVLQTDYAFFVAHDVGRGQAVVLFGSVLLPVVTAVFYRLTERGLLTPYGTARLISLLIALGLAFSLSLAPAFRNPSPESDVPLLLSGGRLLAIPALGLLTLLGCAPFLIIRRKGESPQLGPLLLAALALVFVGLGFPSAGRVAPFHRLGFLLFSTLGALVLVGAVLETAWRHMTLDELTELPGRRALRHRLRCLGENYVLAVVDIDHFKRINDTHGHAVGDQILRFIASELSRHAAGSAYRFGGEEFVIVFERCAYEDALNKLDDIRLDIARKEFRFRGTDRPARRPRSVATTTAGSGPALTFTVSIGAARGGDSSATPQEILESADQALYRAKETGRNKVCHVT